MTRCAGNPGCAPEEREPPPSLGTGSDAPARPLWLGWDGGGETRKRDVCPVQFQWVYDSGDMSITSPIYVEIIDFIAAGTTPQSVADFLPSPEAQQRLAALMEREKAGTLSPEEKAEVDHFMELEHILRMAKARARQIVSRGE